MEADSNYDEKETPLTKETVRFGARLLAKMGWTEGKGLGKKENGITTFVKVKMKKDTEGIGFKRFPSSHYPDKNTEFESLLSALNEQHSTSQQNGINGEHKTSEHYTPLDFEEKSRSFKNRLHYQRSIKMKNVSRYSEKDINSIFGIRQTEESVSLIEDEKLFIKPLNNSMEDYFKQKKEKLDKKQKKKSEKWPSEQHPVSLNIDTDVEILDLDSGNYSINSEKEEKRNKKQKKKSEKWLSEQHPVSLNADTDIEILDLDSGNHSMNSEKDKKLSKKERKKLEKWLSEQQQTSLSANTDTETLDFDPIDHLMHSRKRKKLMKDQMQIKDSGNIPVLLEQHQVSLNSDTDAGILDLDTSNHSRQSKKKKKDKKKTKELEYVQLQCQQHEASLDANSGDLGSGSKKRKKVQLRNSDSIHQKKEDSALRSSDLKKERKSVSFNEIVDFYPIESRAEMIEMENRESTLDSEGENNGQEWNTDPLQIKIKETVLGEFKQNNYKKLHEDIGEYTIPSTNNTLDSSFVRPHSLSRLKYYSQKSNFLTWLKSKRLKKKNKKVYKKTLNHCLQSHVVFRTTNLAAIKGYGNW